MSKFYFNNMKKTHLLFLLIPAVLLFTGCEREGVANIDDCRETIIIKERNIKTYYKTFTCSYNKTEKGDIMNGFCANIKTGLFSDKCKIAYIYDKQPTKECPENEYLNQDGNCYCYEGYIMKNLTCTKPDYTYLLNAMIENLKMDFIWQDINKDNIDEKINKIRKMGYSDWILLDFFSYNNEEFGKLLSRIRNIKYDDSYLLNELSYGLCNKKPTIPSVPNDKSIKFYGNKNDYQILKNYLVERNNSEN